MVLYPRKPIFLILAFSVFVLAESCQKGNSTPPRNTGDTTASTGSSTPPADTNTVYVLAMFVGSSQNPNANTPVVYKNKGYTVLSTNPKAYAWQMVVVDTDVYVSGGIGNNDTSGTACYWKNGTMVTLPILPGALGANAVGLFVSGTDVYVSGVMWYNDPPSVSSPRYGDVAVYWKNGVINTLPDWPYWDNYYRRNSTYDYVGGIFVSNGDVYVAGGEDVYAKDEPYTHHFTGYWKNGTYYDLPNITQTGLGLNTFTPITSEIALSGSDVYASGRQSLPYASDTIDDFSQAMYWKNGVETNLSNPPDQAGAGAILFSGNDVYIGGTATGVGPYPNTEHAMYWKNGVATLVDSTEFSSGLTSLYLFGKDVYATGPSYYGGVANICYWKNGAMTRLAENGEGLAIYVK